MFKPDIEMIAYQHRRFESVVGLNILFEESRDKEIQHVTRSATLYVKIKVDFLLFRVSYTLTEY
jgi:hypothetical protein